MTKPWDRKKNRCRHIETRTLRDRFLIVCEGEKTEPNYFRAFPVNKEVVEIDIEGTGTNTLSLVQKAVELKNRSSYRYNQVWCVFDRDDFPLDNFNKAFSLANKNEIHIAYSNQCFELWYLLHFQYNETAIHRAEYASKLTKAIGVKYQKNSNSMYELLYDKQSDAVRNARKLLVSYPKIDPGRNDPSTTVHLLVEILNKFIFDNKVNDHLS